MFWVCLFAPFAFPLWVHAAELAPLRVGLVVPTVAEAGPVAQHMRRAADLAVADWETTSRRRVELRVEEDAFDLRQALTAAHRLVRDGVWGVVGHYYSSSSIAAATVYREAGIPQLTATATHPRLTALGFDTVFRVCGGDAQQGQTAAHFVMARVKARRVGIVHDRTEYGRGLADAFRQEWTRRAAGGIAAVESLAQGDRDFAAQVGRLKTARVDAIFFGGVFREAGLFLRQVREAGLGAAFVGGDALLDAGFVESAGEAAATGTYLTAAPDPRLLQSAQRLVQRYERLYGSLGPHVVQTYDAVGIVLRAIQAAKPIEWNVPGLRQVAQAIRSAAYHGAMGTLRWAANGDLATSPYVMYVIKQGGRVQGWFDPL